MALSIGIVGLPNVGKSTLFNALSENQAEAENYAFCTIDPNIGVVPVPDERFDKLVEIIEPQKTITATVDFVDIAGLVRGASKGEGRGNAFLTNIRDSDAIAHVVRCFVDDNILHVDNRVDPTADIDTIETELILKDLETVEKRLDKARRMSKGASTIEKKALVVCEALEAILSDGQPARTYDMSGLDVDQQHIVRDLCLITQKPMFYIANVSEDQLGTDGGPLVAQVREIAKSRNAPVVMISAKIEAEIMSLDPEDRVEFLADMGLEKPGLHDVIQTGYAMLDLITYFTAGKKEVRAWTITRGTKAPGAAGKIHTDFERGFIRAEVIKFADMAELLSEAACKAAGKMGLEGKEYVVQDGDIMHFRFNV